MRTRSIDTRCVDLLRFACRDAGTFLLLVSCHFNGVISAFIPPPCGEGGERSEPGGGATSPQRGGMQLHAPLPTLRCASGHPPRKGEGCEPGR